MLTAVESVARPARDAEPPLLVCRSCLAALAEPTVCPVCVRTTCAACLRRDGCVQCLAPIPTRELIARLERALAEAWERPE